MSFVVKHPQCVSPSNRVREPVSLRRLFPTASFVGCADIRVYDATESSEHSGPGVLFAAKPGRVHDGAAHASEAVRRGATALLASRPMAELPVPQCILPDVARAFGVVCANLAGRPMRTVRTAGITGTNGKTTVSWLIRALVESIDRDCGLLGTIEYSDGVSCEKASLTTPDTKTYWDWFSSMAQRGTPFAAVELSSHALHQDRAAGSELDVAVVTNITHDHLDYHQTLAHYLSSKAKILSLVRPGGTIVLNQDDPSVDVLRSLAPAGVDIRTFGLCHRAAVTATDVRQTASGLSFTLSLRGQQSAIRTRLHGRHNIANCLAAAAAAEHFGLSPEQIATGLALASSPPGRMELVESSSETAVFVDYAHTPDALQNAISTVRGMTNGRVIVVFGAGGDRDRLKRPLLGRAASAADVVVVTSDNPRREDPDLIIEEIVGGLDLDRCEACVEPDRADAIALAVSLAEPHDVVLIAGKGHEKFQQFADHSVMFDDCAIAARALRSKLKKVTARKFAA